MTWSALAASSASFEIVSPNSIGLGRLALSITTGGRTIIQVAAGHRRVVVVTAALVKRRNLIDYIITLTLARPRAFSTQYTACLQRWALGIEWLLPVIAIPSPSSLLLLLLCQLHCAFVAAPHQPLATASWQRGRVPR
jgi:hypothetical protein